MSYTPFCPSPREGRVPGCRPAAVLPRTPQRANSPAAEGGKKGTRPPRAKIPTPWKRVYLASCVCAAATAEKFHALLQKNKKGHPFRNVLVVEVNGLEPLTLCL